MSLRKFIELQLRDKEAQQQKDEDSCAKNRAAEQLFYDLELAFKEALRKFFADAGCTRCIESTDRLSLFFYFDDMLSATVTFEMDDYLSIHFDTEERQLGRVVVQAISDEELLFFPLRENESLTWIKPMSLQEAVEEMFLRVA